MEFLEIVVGPNTTPQNRLVRWWLPPLINTCSNHVLSDVRLFNTSLHSKHYWEWFTYIYGGWPDSENLIKGVLMDLNGDSDIILEIVVTPNTTLQNRLW